MGKVVHSCRSPSQINQREVGALRLFTVDLPGRCQPRRWQRRYAAFKFVSTNVVGPQWTYERRSVVVLRNLKSVLSFADEYTALSAV